jgi:hypothetical protein
VRESCDGGLWGVWGLKLLRHVGEVFAGVGTASPRWELLGGLWDRNVMLAGEEALNGFFGDLEVEVYGHMGGGG